MTNRRSFIGRLFAACASFGFIPALFGKVTTGTIAKPQQPLEGVGGQFPRTGRSARIRCAEAVPMPIGDGSWSTSPLTLMDHCKLAVPPKDGKIGVLDIRC